MSGPPRALIHLLFLVSGATGLVYQVTWLRDLSLVFGASFEATSIVLASFMAGLCAGGFAFARRAERIERAFLVYGALELGVAVFALAVPVLLRALDAAYVRAAMTTEEVTPALNLLRVAMALVILFVPTFLMGGTLPVLTQGLVQRFGEFGTRLSWLYGVNTLGAVLGALGAGFFLIPALGVWNTQLLAAAANVGVAVAAIAADRVLSRATPRDGAEPAPAPAVVHDQTPGGLRALRLADFGAAISGLCALSLEVMWTRAISMAVGATTYSFTVMLAAFLTGIWIGSWLHAALPLRRLGPALQLGLVLCVIGLASALASLWIPRLPELAVRLNVEIYGLAPRIRSGTALLLGFLVMLVPCVFMGVAFPLAGEARALLMRGFGRSAGDVLGLNTAGAIAGSLLAGFVLIPGLGLQRGMLLAAGLYVAYGCLLLVAALAIRGPRAVAIAGAASVTACGALLAPWWVRPWDLDLLGAFQNDHLAFWTDEQGVTDLAARMAGWSILYYREGRASTVSVVDQGWNRTLIVNGKAEASDDPIDGHIQRMLGHVPVLMHPDPKSAFVLGMGTGITLGAVMAHPGLEEIVLGEIEPAVLGARPFFAAVNGDPLGDPRLRVRIQDGRNTLKTTPRRFDVITADPIHPWTSGSVYLYTREYYRIARERLTPQGVMCQWLPITGLSAADVRSVMATFAGVFPHTSLWQSSHDVLLIGSTQPIALDLERLTARIASPRVRRQLAVLGLDDPIAFLAEQGMDDADVREYAEGAVVNTDDNVFLEFSSPLSIGSPDVRSITLRVNRARSGLGPGGGVPVAGLDAVGLRRLEAARRAKNRLLEAQVMPKRNIERLQQLVAALPDYRPARIQLARRLSQLGAVALEADRGGVALERSRQALAAASDEPSAHLLQGSLLARQGRYADAIAPIERAIALAPERWMAHYQLALALFGVGRSAEATAELERAATLNPAHEELAARLAQARAAGG